MEKYSNYICYKINDIIKYELVSGYKIDENCFIYHDKKQHTYYNWVITDIKTGFSVCGGKTKQDCLVALELCKEMYLKVLNNPLPKIKEHIERLNMYRKEVNNEYTKECSGKNGGC